MPYRRFSQGRRAGRRYGSRSWGGSGRRNVWSRTWARSAVHPVATALNTVDLLPEGTSPDFGVDRGSRLGSTVMRIRGNIELHVIGSVSPYLPQVYLGITVCGVGANPSPENESSAYQWLHWERHGPASSKTFFYSGAAGTADFAFGWDFDVKAKRLITQPAETLKLCIEADPLFPLANFNDWQIVASTLLRTS